MLSEQELIQKKMEQTRGSLTEKLEALEGQVAETVSSTAGAVQDTTQAVQETVAAVTEKVQETMNAVTDKVQETVQTVGETFSLRTQMERHPWLVMGGAVAIGCVIGSSFGGQAANTGDALSGASPPPPPPPWGARSKGTSANGRDDSSQADGPSLWSGALAHLKNIGVSYVMAIVRDLARNELPEAVASRVAEEVDALTTKLGTEPIPGPVLPAKDSTESETDTTSAKSPESQERKSTSYRGRAPSTATVY